MSIFTDVAAEIVGAQAPRLSCVPEYDDDELGDRAVTLCGECGLELDEWEQYVLRTSLNRRDDGKWAAVEVGVDVPRQNGKGEILIGREAAGLFLLGERLLVHSAHQFDTSLEGFRRLIMLLDDNPKLSRQIKPRGVSWSHGSEGIELRNGHRIRFRTRTKGGGRGFSGDWLGLDEAMYLPESAFGALLPTLSARPNPQIWYTGSAVDQEVHADGVVFARVRERGIAGTDERLFYAEWSVEGEDPGEVDEALATDPLSWAQANPGLGIRISTEFVEMERRAMANRTFAVERLGIGDWPPTEQEGEISLQAWALLVDVQSEITGPLVFCFDVTPDRSRSSICVAGVRADGHSHLEVVDRRPGTDWVVERMAELYESHEPDEIVCDGQSPAASLLPALEKLGLKPRLVTGPEQAQGCGLLVDAVTEKTVRHLGQPPMASALKGAAKRPLGDSWAWSRKSSQVDISPLVACTLALWGLEKQVDGPMIQVFR